MYVYLSIHIHQPYALSILYYFISNIPNHILLLNIVPINAYKYAKYLCFSYLVLYKHMKPPKNMQTINSLLSLFLYISFSIHRCIWLFLSFRLDFSSSSRTVNNFIEFIIQILPTTTFANNLIFQIRLFCVISLQIKHTQKERERERGIDRETVQNSREGESKRKSNNKFP